MPDSVVGADGAPNRSDRGRIEFGDPMGVGSVGCRRSEDVVLVRQMDLGVAAGEQVGTVQMLLGGSPWWVTVGVVAAVGGLNV